MVHSRGRDHNRTILDEFFRVAFRENCYESFEALQADMDVWLEHYNRERPHRGYRNRGKHPYDTVRMFVSEHGPGKEPADKG